MKFERRFKSLTVSILEQLGERPFHIRGPINLAALDSVYTLLLPKYSKLPSDLKGKLDNLYADEDFQEAIYFNTSDSITVKNRLKIAKTYLK